ncbi:hypothetical protein [Oceaniglobus trochenteri]|nr:hypothetical protein [Oceaniglobus trochenteri]
MDDKRDFLGVWGRRPAPRRPLALYVSAAIAIVALATYLLVRP